MRQLGRGILLGLALAGLAAVLFQFAWAVYGLLEGVPVVYIWAVLYLLLCAAVVSYAKWLWSKWRRARREKQWYEGENAAFIQAHEPDVDKAMEELELDVHEWSTRGDTPGSLAGSVIGLEAADAHLEGDV